MRAQSSYTEPLDHELVVIDNDDDDKVNDTKTALGQLDAILQDKDEYLNLVSQQGELAQSLLDLLQSLSNTPQTSPQFRSAILKAILRLSRQSNLYPQCLTIENVRQLGEHPVASGGFGEIWMGTIEGSEDVVCLKVVKLYQKSDIEKVLKNFLREAIVWRQLEHPNVLPFLGLYFLNARQQRLCLISPWMENGNLVQFLERTPRSDVNHRQLAPVLFTDAMQAWDVASGLQYLHRMKIIHADLKGANILMTNSGRATIGDFGLSYVAEGEILRMTSTSAFSGGTPRWLAPELLSPSSRPSYKSDIYAFGCVCYEIYTGLRPFHDLLYDAAVLLQIMQGNRPSRPQDLPELDDDVWALIQRCWAAEPTSRPDIEEIRSRLDALFGAVEPAPPWELTVMKHIWMNIQGVEMVFHSPEITTFLSQSHERLRTRSESKEDTAPATFTVSEKLLLWQRSQLPVKPDDWTAIIDPVALMKLNRPERDRQRIIFELIESEMGFVENLENIISMYMKPLQTSETIIPSDKHEWFLSTVFSDLSEIVSGHREFLSSLHHLQREDYPAIRSIVAPMERMIADLYYAYLRYLPNLVLAEYTTVTEKETNAELRRFFKGRTDLFIHLLNLPKMRVADYETLLHKILSATPSGHDDLTAIPRVLQSLKNLAFDMEPSIRTGHQQVEARRLITQIIFKPNEYVDLDLRHEHRILKHRGVLFRKPQEGSHWKDWNELHVFLFDHYLVMTQEKERDGQRSYIVHGKPVPIELLSLLNFDGLPIARTSSFDSVSTTNTTHFYPFSVQHVGRSRKRMFFFTDSEDARTQWRERLETAISQRNIVQVFDLKPMNTDTFWFQSIPQSKIPISSHSAMTGRIACSVVFHLDKRRFMIVGCFEGVWMGLASKPAGFKRVLTCRNVKQCAVIEELDLLLVLAENTLFGYKIRDLWDSSTSPDLPRYKLRNTSVQYFRLGTITGGPVVIVMGRKGPENSFTILRPVAENIGRKSHGDWFTAVNINNFSVGTDSSGLDIIGKSVCAVAIRTGFELVDLDDPSSKRRNLPTLDDSVRSISIAKRMEACNKLRVFELELPKNELLLCFDHFGIFTDPDGLPSRGDASIVEWEGNAEKAVLHFPFILLFSTGFVEVRDVCNGSLTQVIARDEVQCISDDSVVPDPATPTQRNPIQVANNVFEPASGIRPARITQHIYELVPYYSEL
ncbi:Rho guanine nucleotide exchange factor [Paramarasmius palmivorus]|uniref:Rho guanine nucleotide exchange factor n=1 Tax=Paramarasmius palmivorus TaxID=297713 RepID=A0AAW0EBT3_9AGAR